MPDNRTAWSVAAQFTSTGARLCGSLDYSLKSLVTLSYSLITECRVLVHCFIHRLSIPKTNLPVSETFQNILLFYILLYALKNTYQD